VLILPPGGGHADVAEGRHFSGRNTRAGRGFELANGIAPKLWSRLAPLVMERLAFSSGASPVSRGNLFEPLHDQASAPR
jgi:hypothetical protein